MIQICSDKHQVLQVYPVITETWFQCLPKIILAEYVDIDYKEKKKKICCAISDPAYKNVLSTLERFISSGT